MSGNSERQAAKSIIITVLIIIVIHIIRPVPVAAAASLFPSTPVGGSAWVRPPLRGGLVARVSVVAAPCPRAKCKCSHLHFVLGRPAGGDGPAAHRRHFVSISVVIAVIAIFVCACVCL